MDKDHKAELKKIKKLGKDADRLVKGKLPAKVKQRRMLVIIMTAAVLFPFVFPPMRLPVAADVSSGFFIRSRPESLNPFALEFHRGTDFPVPMNTPVRAASSGVVQASGWSDTLGNYVIVGHLFGVSTLYGHLAGPGTKEGRFILRGFKIGNSGSTGRSTGPHLHFETRFRGKPVPPGVLLFFTRIRSGFISLVVS